MRATTYTLDQPRSSPTAPLRAPVKLTIALKQGDRWLIWKRTMAKIAVDGTYRGIARMETGYRRVHAAHFNPSAVSMWRYFTVE